MFLTFCKTPDICSYLPVESGKFSKLITSQISLENFSDDGNLLYGDVLGNIGVPKCIDLTEAWFISEDLWGIERIGVELDWGILSETDVFNVVLRSFLIDVSGQHCKSDFIESWLEDLLEVDGVTVTLENGVSDINIIFESFLIDMESELECELVSSISISNTFFALSNSDKDGEFVIEIVSSWKGNAIVISLIFYMLKNIAILWRHTAKVPSKEGNSCDCESESSITVWDNSITDGTCTDSFGNGGTKCPLIDTFSTAFSVLMKKKLSFTFINSKKDE